MSDGAVGDGPPSRPSSRTGSLRALLDGVAAELPGLTAVQAGDRRTWSRDGIEFSVLEADAVELRLDGPIAAAALRTPDTSTSGRGLPWVRFAPRALDGHAVDRTTAWFGLAYRRAVPR